MLFAACGLPRQIALQCQLGRRLAQRWPLAARRFASDEIFFSRPETRGQTGATLTLFTL
jgi:hypothetical protein